MPIFDFSTPVKKNNKGKYKVIKEKYTIKVRKVKGIVFIDKDGSYKVLIEDSIVPIKQECFTCKGASNIYMQELEKKSIRNIYIRFFIHGHVHMSYGRNQKRYDQYNQTHVINAYDRCVFDYEDDKASNIFKEYKDNYDGLNQARIDKILRERNE